MPAKITYGEKLANWARHTMPPLLPWQIEAGNRIYDQRKLMLHSDPGAGKTLAALEGMSQYNQTATPSRVLIVCPVIALTMWPTWVATILDHDYPKREWVIQVIKSSADVISSDTTHIVCTYGVLALSVSKLVQRLLVWKPEFVILDECDVLSNLSANKTATILGADGLATKAKWVVPVTGTPIVRYADGLFPVLKALFFRRLYAKGWHTKERFIQQFCHTRKVKYGRMRIAKTVVTGNKNREKLHEFLYSGDTPIAVRTKVDLPKGVHEREIFIDFKESKRLRELTLATVEALKDEENSMSGDLVTALVLLGVDKAPEIIKYIYTQVKKKRSVGDERGVFVLFWHKKVGDVLQEHLIDLGLRVTRIDGSTSANARMKVQQDFNEGETDVLLGQIAAAGVAIDLQHNCNHVIFAERDWSAARQEQALRRVLRLGQKTQVQVDYCVSANELDDMKTRTLRKKEAGTAAIIDSKM